MEKMELYKKVALELKEKLGPNHVSTILQLDTIEGMEKIKKSAPQLLIIVKNFDKFTLMMITNILKEYPNEFDVPYVVEYKDVKGMLDSIPKSFLDFKLNYFVLAGDDVTEMIRPPSYEHFRAQTELVMRNDISKLRRDLIRVMTNKMSTQEYLKDLSIVALNCIRNYYQIIDPQIRTTDELTEKFKEDYPDGDEALQNILEFTYQSIRGEDITEEDKLQRILSTFDYVIQPLLIEINNIGIEFEKSLSKDSERLSFDEFIEKYSEEISRLQDAMTHEFETEVVKHERILRGELELKFRKREKNMVEEYEREIMNLKKVHEVELQKQNQEMNEQIESRSQVYIKEKLDEEREKLKEEYDKKYKEIRDELELKYITSDLSDREERLRKEYNAYEKKLRDDFERKEKDLRAELEANKKIFEDSLELEYRAKLEDEKDEFRDLLEEEFDDRLRREMNKMERKYEAEIKRRERNLESTLNKEFKRREKELLLQFKRDLQAKEKEVKATLELTYERERGKMESKRYDELMKLVEKQISLRYQELEKIQSDMMSTFNSSSRTINIRDKDVEKSSGTRNFMAPPEDSDDDEEGGGDLFSTIMKDNRNLTRGLTKKNVKKVS
jgi:hypothetical protein